MEPNRHDGAMIAQRETSRRLGDSPVEDGAMPALPDRRAQPRDRRMHLRAYNHWASMLDRRRFPAVADLASGTLGDIAPHSVLLDVSADAEAPAIAYLGERLAGECGAPDGTLQRLNDAPGGSLLARLGEHYRTVLINRAPTGFESEYDGLRGATVLYRGILLPFSSDDVTIDFVLAVINWKEESRSGHARPPQVAAKPLTPCRRTPPSAALTDWADGPGSELGSSPDFMLADDLSEEMLPPEGGPEHLLGGEEAPIPSAEADPLSENGLAENLRMLPLHPLAALPFKGSEFALAIIRRQEGEAPALLGEVPHDPGLIQQAARRLVG